MTTKQKLDYSLLADIFPAPLKPKNKIQHEQNWKTVDGHSAWVIRSGYGEEAWEGGFYKHPRFMGVTYYARTKRELLADMDLVERTKS
jgi:hypothetical protein